MAWVQGGRRVDTDSLTTPLAATQPSKFDCPAGPYNLITVSRLPVWRLLIVSFCVGGWVPASATGSPLPTATPHRRARGALGVKPVWPHALSRPPNAHNSTVSTQRHRRARQWADRQRREELLVGENGANRQIFPLSGHKVKVLRKPCANSSSLQPSSWRTAI